MQLVVMAAVLALAGAGPGCSFSCRPTDVNITVESCGRTGSILTTICAGQCNNEDLVYISDTQTYEQEMCIGVWANEVKHIDGCPEGVTYPVAKNCNCEVCDPNKNTDCTRFTGKASSCLAI
ncbi:gonadotropin subunit beta-1-like [Pseudoliparis swirei]|uniref:gonadotropin subunit beta-1-like n=1 Tax=Pseudoliparis swirei TaxID=2059687 RepID=UPI0024BEF8C3|nr:gonadotropin subunit beta-1-like [Pseudoliparis swirei]